MDSNPYALEYVSDELKIVMNAIVKIPHSLQYASEQLKDDKEVVFTSIQKEPIFIVRKIL